MPRQNSPLNSITLLHYSRVTKSAADARSCIVGAKVFRKGNDGKHKNSFVFAAKNYNEIKAVGR